MTSWVMAVEVTPSELVALDVDRADRAGAGSPAPRRVPLGPDADGDRTDRSDQDPVDLLADAFARAVAGAGDPDDGARPARVVVATPPDTERRRFEEIAEATALVGLPAPSWLPGPVALVGDRIAAEVEVGGQSVVLDARGGGLTAWPVRRTAAGAEIGSRGPIATGTRLDQLLLGVVRAQLRSLDGVEDVGDGPRPGSRAPGAARDLRGEAARLRRSIRRARARLAGEDVDEARVVAEDHEVVVDRGVFDQLVEHAVRESLAEVADGPEDLPDPVVHVLTDEATPLARRLAELTAGADRVDAALVVPGDAHDGVIGLAALLRPARSRPARAASGAQAIRAARSVGSPPTPVGVGVGSPGSSGTVETGDGPPDDPDLHTPATGLPRADGDDDVLVPEARLPSSPVQAQHRDDSGAGAPGPLVAPEAIPHPETPEDHDDGDGPDRVPDHPPAGRPELGHLALATAVPHEVRPASDAPPGGGPTTGPGPVVPGPGGPHGDRPPGPDGAGDPGAADGEARVPRATVRGRRGPDTAPQPVPERDDRAGRAPRGAVPVLVVLLVLAVLAAVGVLLVGPDQVDAAFAGLGAGTGVLPIDLPGLTR